MSDRRSQRAIGRGLEKSSKNVRCLQTSWQLHLQPTRQLGARRYMIKQPATRDQFKAQSPLPNSSTATNTTY